MPMKDRIDGVRDAKSRRKSLVADEPTDGRGGAAGAGAAYDPGGNGVFLLTHLRKDALGDVVVAAPVGGAFCVGELIQIVSVRFRGEALCFGIDGPRIRDGMDLPAMETYGVQFRGRRRGGYDCNEPQAQKSCEVRLRD